MNVQFIVGVGLSDAVNGERIGKLAGGRDDFGLFARELDLERINAAFLFALYFRAVRGEFYAVDVGIHFDQRIAARAVDKAFARDVQDRFGRPVRLVRVKTVLARFAIERDETFVVHARLAALVSRVCCEVKHIPHVRAPKIRVTLRCRPEGSLPIRKHQKVTLRPPEVRGFQLLERPTEKAPDYPIYNRTH